MSISLPLPNPQLACVAVVVFLNKIVFIEIQCLMHLYTYWLYIFAQVIHISYTYLELSYHDAQQASKTLRGFKRTLKS